MGRRLPRMRVTAELLLSLRNRLPSLQPQERGRRSGWAWAGPRRQLRRRGRRAGFRLPAAGAVAAERPRGGRTAGRGGRRTGASAREPPRGAGQGAGWPPDKEFPRGARRAGETARHGGPRGAGQGRGDRRTRGFRGAHDPAGRGPPEPVPPAQLPAGPYPLLGCLGGAGSGAGRRGPYSGRRGGAGGAGGAPCPLTHLPGAGAGRCIRRRAACAQRPPGDQRPGVPSKLRSLSRACHLCQDELFLTKV